MEEKLEESISKMAQYVPVWDNTLKVIEECTETNEVLIKTLTKSENYKPKVEKIIEEMGDAMYRMMVLARQLDIEGEVQGRIEEKAQIMLKWVTKKYENGKSS